MNDRSMTEPTNRSDTRTVGSPSPIEVAQRWVTAMREADAEQLRDLYEVGAAVHLADDVVLGPDRIATSLLGRPGRPDADTHTSSGGHGMVVLTWGDDDVDQAESTRLRVRKGKIVEQWIGERRSSAGRLQAVPMNMSVSGDVSAEEHDLVWDMVDQLVSMRDEAVLHVDVRLTQQAERTRLDPVSLRVNIGLNGGSVRATARAADVRTVSKTVERRLKHALHRRAERRSESQRTAGQSIRSADPSPHRAESQRPPSEREVVRHKTVSPGPSTLEEATFDLETMGYDFFLYVDIETGRDALVATTDDAVVELLDPPVASVSSARARLDAGNEPFVFFQDEDTDRGHVLYRRFDGHYGLIVPADS